MLSTRRTRLEPPSLEAEFRADALASDKRMAGWLAVVTIIFVVVTLPATFSLDANPERLHQVWALRAIDLAAAVAGFALARRATAARSYDMVVVGWVAVLFIGFVAENALLPATVTSFVSWDGFIAVTVYVALPLPLARQALLAGILSGGDLLVLWLLKSQDQSFDIREIALAYACANLVGAFVSRERHGLRRDAFVALKHEVAARTALEEAHAEIRTLQGILPICSFCKQIRTEAGDWETLEAYVRERSDTQFSHGVCPDCMRIHYPQFERR